MSLYELMHFDACTCNNLFWIFSGTTFPENPPSEGVRNLILRVPLVRQLITDWYVLDTKHLPDIRRAYPNRMHRTTRTVNSLRVNTRKKVPPGTAGEPNKGTPQQACPTEVQTATKRKRRPVGGVDIALYKIFYFFRGRPTRVIDYYLLSP